MTSDHRRRLTIYSGVALVCAICAVGLAPAMGDIAFEKVTYPMTGLPDHFYVHLWARMPGPADAGCRVVLVSAVYIGGSESRVGDMFRLKVYIVALGPKEGSVVETVCDLTLEKEAYPQRLCVADLDQDGSAELYFSAHYPESNIAFARSGGTWNRIDPPYPKLWDNNVVSLDYNRDRWPDMFVSGKQETAKEENGVRKLETVSEPRMLLKNVRGTLEPTETVFDVPEGIDSAQAIDINQDGYDDLIVFPKTTRSFRAIATRIYLGKETGLEEVEFPFRIKDKLIGVSSGKAVAGDLNGDGKIDLIVLGRRSWQMAKGELSVVYKGFGKSPDRPLFSIDSDMTDALPDMQQIDLIDLDTDGDLDIVGTESSRASESLRNVTIIENKGGTLTVLPDLLGPEYGSWRNVIPCDVNSDGLVDLVCFPIPSRHPVVLLLNKSVARSPTATTAPRDEP